MQAVTQNMENYIESLRLPNSNSVRRFTEIHDHLTQKRQSDIDSERLALPLEALPGLALVQLQQEIIEN